MPGLTTITPKQELLPMEEIQAVVVDALVPLPYRHMGDVQMQCRDRYERFLVNPGGVNGIARKRAVTPKEIERLFRQNRIVGGIELYRDLGSDMKRRTPRLYEVMGGEVLPRVIDDEGNVLRPATFIEAARKAGILQALSLRIIRIGCAIAKAVNDLSGPDMKVTFNVSEEMLEDPAVVDRVGDIVDQLEFPANNVYLEVLENKRLEPRAIDAIRPVTRSDDSIHMAIDDYPKAHAIENLERLKDAGIAPVMVKIDGATVHGLTKETLAEMEGHIRSIEDGGATIIVFEGCDDGIPPHAIRLLRQLQRSMRADNGRHEVEWWFEGSPSSASSGHSRRPRRSGATRVSKGGRGK